MKLIRPILKFAGKGVLFVISRFDMFSKKHLWLCPSASNRQILLLLWDKDFNSRKAFSSKDLSLPEDRSRPQVSMNKTKWIWLYDCEKRPQKTIKSQKKTIKRPYNSTKSCWMFSFEHFLLANDFVPLFVTFFVWFWTNFILKLFCFLWYIFVRFGQILFANIFYSIWNFFWTWFQEKKKNKASYKTFEHSSRSK